MKIKKPILLLSLIAACVRCSDIEYKKRTEKLNASRLAADETFEVKLRGLNEPNKYQAEIIYTGNRPENWTVVRKSAQNKMTSFAVNATREAPLADSDLQSGETYTYTIGKTKDGKFEAAEEKTIIVPNDIIISGTKILKEDDIKSLNKSFRLYFQKDSILKVENQDVDLEVEEIYSDSGRLQTFSDTDVAPQGQDGLPTGKIHLKAQRITGPFTIEIRGQRGGKGFKGETGHQGPQGPASPRLTNNQPINAGFELSNGRHVVCNLHGFQTYAATHPCPGISYQECRWLLHPGVGGKGATGYQGFQGHEGRTGGSALKTDLEIPLSENIQIIYQPGAGGEHGDGGDGGPGGPGGPGAAIVNNAPGDPCEPSPEGRPGDTGPQGPNGPEGVPGRKETLTLNGEVQP